jgi:DnaJ-like protein
MADLWIPLAVLNASLFTLAPMSFGLGWASMVFGSAAGPPRPHPDLLALGLDRMPSSWDDLRRAYRSAARKAHPDVHGGSAEAFLAVAAAFERLSETLGRRAA